MDMSCYTLPSYSQTAALALYIATCSSPIFVLASLQQVTADSARMAEQKWVVSLLLCRMQVRLSGCNSEVCITSCSFNFTHLAYADSLAGVYCWHSGTVRASTGDRTGLLEGVLHSAGGSMMIFNESVPCKSGKISLHP